MVNTTDHQDPLKSSGARSLGLQQTHPYVRMHTPNKLAVLMERSFHGAVSICDGNMIQSQRAYLVHTVLVVTEEF